MMDYEAFWRGFVLLFLIVPFFVGACAGFPWAWHKGRRGLPLVYAAIIGGIGLCLCVFFVALLFFRA